MKLPCKETTISKRHLSDWITYYLKYSQNTEPPVQYHMWSAIMAISSCLQRKCWLDWGHDTIYPNFYTVLVGPPGGRKGTAMKIAKSMVRDIGIVIGSDSLGSIQTLYMELADSKATYFNQELGEMLEHKSLSVWSEEFQVFLSDNNPLLIMNITDLFDCPNTWKYSTRSRGTEDLSGCWLSIFGAITPSLLQSRLSQDAVGGGLLSRIVFVVGYGKAKRVPITFLSKEEKELKKLLLDDLQCIHQLQGPFRPTAEFIQKYAKWYVERGGHSGVDSHQFVGYNERRALHLRKLCMVISASQSNDMILRERHLDTALAVLEYTEKEMPNAFYGLGRSQHAGLTTDFIDFLKEHTEVTWTQIMQRFHLDGFPSDLSSILGTLELTGDVQKKIVNGKTTYVYIKNEVVPQDVTHLRGTLFKELDYFKGGE